MSQAAATASPAASAADSPASEVRRVADAVRRRVLDYTLKNNGGYLSQACSSAETLATLYLRVLRLGPSTAPLVPRPFAGVPGPDNPDAFTGADYNGPRAPALDRFIFSPVHYALVLYSLLIELGRLGPNGLDAFNQDGSTVELIGAEHSPGHEVTAGSLGQALSQAGGIALARRLKGETGRVWVFMSDGEFQEGQTWEAFAALAHHRIGNLGVYIDANAQQCDGAMADTMTIEPLAERLRAVGAEVHEVDGHDSDALAAAAEGFGGGDRPLAVIARTDPCRGVELMRERAPKLHYLRFKSDAERQAYQQLLAALSVEAPA
ncbi:transketolase [Thiohalocapsa halophila]|uniref:Transketolase n=1 Tax=Thiohalocapsa halophila TaxID=69359 RepID=A0ABS1CCZ7_9GAMM|nr:1-deoxy-D-xylulose-5-phosphate synthase N-terminal domain-containing protein [Thiohalocapsa halophila]MBK1629748.1 transketolase [Thiohalocapsa halophila]